MFSLDIGNCCRKKVTLRERKVVNSLRGIFYLSVSLPFTVFGSMGLGISFHKGCIAFLLGTYFLSSVVVVLNEMNIILNWIYFGTSAFISYSFHPLHWLWQEEWSRLSSWFWFIGGRRDGLGLKMNFIGRKGTFLETRNVWLFCRRSRFGWRRNFYYFFLKFFANTWKLSLFYSGMCSNFGSTLYSAGAHVLIKLYIP